MTRSKNARHRNGLLEEMTKRGLRITDQRRTIAKLFAQTEGYLAPRDIYEQLREQYPGVSLDTVYRNLRLLCDMGLLNPFYFMEGGLKFKASDLDHHHHLLICINCESTIAFDFCPMDHLGNLPGRYRIVNHRFEIYGICEECQ